MSHESLDAHRFDLIRPLGEGAAGDVLLVFDRTRERTVALKILKAKEHHPEGILRFKQEFHLLKRLRHPHLLQVHDYGVATDGRHFFTMEALEDPLESCAVDQLPGLLREILQALAFLHARGFVHGDVTLANLRRRSDGSVALIDFGLMVPVGFAAKSPRGTPAYMAPEAVKGGRLDGRSDLYSLGAVAYQLAAGRLPFDASHGLAQMRAQLERAVESPSRYNPALSVQLDRVITRLLSKDPVARFQSAQEVLAALGFEADADHAFVPLASHFAGRHAELADLERMLEAASRGHGGDRRFVGAPGSGKSRLLEEFALRAQLAGACVEQGACTEGAIPYAPFLEPLRHLVSLLPDERLDPLKGALGALLNELKSESDLALDPQKEAARLRAAILEVVTQVASRMPVVLVLDDWQWADPSSEELLCALSKAAETQALVLLVAGRDFVPGAHGLEALALDEVRDMAASMLGDAHPDERFVEQLYLVTGGQPAAVEATIREVTGSARLKRQAGRWLYDPQVLEGQPASAGSSARLRERFVALPEAPRRAAQIAALIGRPFAQGLMLQSLALDDEIGLEALERLEVQGILGRKGDRLWFVDPSWPSLLRESLREPEARALHTAIASVLLEGDGESDRLGYLNDLARHTLAGERPEDGVDWAILAARANMGLYAVSATRDLMARALPHARQDDQLRWIHQLLGDAERYASHSVEARSHYEQAIAATHDDAVAGRLLTNCGLCSMIEADYGDALARFEMADKRLDGEDEREWLRCLTYQARAHYFDGAIAEATAVCRRALARARAFGDPRWLCACLGLLGMLCTVAEGRHEEGISLLQEALAHAEALGDLIEQGETYSLLGVAQLATGDLTAARASFERNLDLAQRANTPNDVVVAQLNLAMVAHEQGAIPLMASVAEAARRGSESIGSDLYAGIALLLGATAEAARGDLDQAHALLADVHARLEAQPQDYLALMAASYGSEIALASGQLLRARGLAFEALELGTTQGNPEFENRSRLAAADALIRLAEFEEAFEVLLPLRAAPSRLDRAKAGSLLALAAWRSEASDDAAAVAEDALRALVEAGADRWCARTRILLAEMALASHDRATATSQLEAALSLANGCEVPQLACHALFVLAASQDEQRFATLRRVQDVLRSLKDRMSSERYEEMLALDELWSASQGEVHALDRRHGLQATDGPLVQEKLYQAALMREQRLLAEIEVLKADKRRHEIMMRFLAETSGEYDYQEALRRTIASVASLLEADEGLLLLPDSAGRLEVYSVYKVDAANVMGFSRTIAESCFRSGETVFISDTEASPHFAALQSVIDLQIQSALAVPLRSEEGTMGVIYIHRHTIFHGFTPEDRAMAEMFARHAAKTLTQTRLLAESTEMTRRVSLLNQLARSLSQSLDLPIVLERAVHAALDFTSAGRALVLLSENGELRCRQALDRFGPLVPDSVSYPVLVCQDVLEQGTAVSRLVADDAGEDPFGGMQLRTVLGAPMVVGDRTLGVLYVDSQEVVTSWVDSHLEMLEAIASQVAIAIHTAQRFETR